MLSLFLVAALSCDGVQVQVAQAPCAACVQAPAFLQRAPVVAYQQAPAVVLQQAPVVVRQQAVYAAPVAQVVKVRAPRREVVKSRSVVRSR